MSKSNPQTEDFIQWSDLKQRENLDPPDEIAAKRKYPIKAVNSIYRAQSLDGKEFLMTRQTWTGLDMNGNEIQKSFDDMETWLRPFIRYESRPVDPRNRWSKLERKVTGVSSEVKTYDKAFGPQALDELYTLRSSSCQLIILKVDEAGRKLGNPYIIKKYEDFRNRAFDDLYAWALTPRTQDQTKLGKEETNERNKQYG